MEEAKAPEMPATVEACEAEIKALFAATGQLQYSMKIQEAQIAQINQRALALNQHAHKLKSEAPKQEAPPA